MLFQEVALSRHDTPVWPSWPSILCAPCVPSSAQNQGSIFESIRLDHESVEKGSNQQRIFALSSVVAASIDPQSIDVKHYSLQLQLTPNELGTEGIITGTVTILGETTATVSAINVDAQPNLNIESVTLNAATNNFRRKNARIVIPFPAPVSPGTPFAVVIQYQGPGSGLSGQGLLFTRHGPNFLPVMASFSEPFGAPLWWPCVDNPADKATVEVEVTVPEGNQAASNGVLDRAQANPDHTVTYFWREDSPLSTYLVSVAATNYEKLEDSYTALDGVTEMPLLFYVYPEHLEPARAKFGVVRPAMEIYAALFGEYPFLGEKYGWENGRLAVRWSIKRSPA